jgi:NADPH2:quinone reductase
LAYYCANREELLWRAGDVLQWIASGKLKLAIDRTYRLAQVAQAHRDLESRVTAGKVLLIPEGA